MSSTNQFCKAGLSVAALALALGISAAPLVPAHAATSASAAARHKAALAAKAKAAAAAAAKAKAAKASGIAPLPSTGAGANAGSPSDADAPGGTAANATLLYSGSALASGPVQAMAWGGGTAADHAGDSYTTAGHTIQINTAGLYQGGQIMFSSPVELGDVKTETSRYLQIIFSASPSEKYPKVIPYSGGGNGYGGGGYRGGYRGGPAGAPGAGGYAPGNAQDSGALPGVSPTVLDAHSAALPAGAYRVAQAYPGGYPGAGRRRGPFGGYPGGPGGANPYGRPGANPYGRGSDLDDTAALPDVPIKQVHVIYEYADGHHSETLRPITLTLGQDVNWLRAGIPLSALPAPPAGDAQLSKIYIGTDTPALLNVGEIRLVSDATAITADAGKDKTIPLHSSVTLVGSGEGGASTLKYEWNFDSPNAQPFVAEQEGVIARYTYDTPGDHVVTLRVSDLDGIKQPATATVTIHVVDQGTMPNTTGPGGYPGAGYPGVPGGPPPGYRPGFNR